MDSENVPALIAAGLSSETLAAAQTKAKIALEADGHGPWPKDGCAANLSALLQIAGVRVRMTLGALDLARKLAEERRWERIDEIGRQKPGDVGVCSETDDHIYLVLECIDNDEMLIADNQCPHPHKRYASGRGKTPTKYFLRAS